ncbi:MAG: response regulator, partial [Bacteroidales bacterium]|nr:response regulator [Bacteroidales bacterium]
MNKINISLLYVEDEKILRNVYQKILSKRISEIYVAENGEEGLALYEQHRPNIVLTDIKMPVMNGLEMSKRIKRFDPNARIIIMSAYGQTQYFMQAIESGVKSFLLKPVENKSLFTVIENLTNEVLLERKVSEQKEKRRQAEEALKRSEAILKAVSYASEQFLQHNFGEKSIPLVLQKLGDATAASRVYIFENHKSETGELLCSQRFEWTADNIPAQSGNPNLKSFPYNFGFNRWKATLPQGKPISGLIRDFPKSEQEVLSEQEIISIAIVPVISDNSWWGFIGLDNCSTERTWTTTELNALSAAADIFGAAIHRKKVEEELLSLNNELELRVENRTRDLKKEINERKTAEMMLRESEEKYRQIFENANDGIMLTIDGIVKFINPKLYEMTGYLPKECIDRPFSEFLHPDYVDLVTFNHKRRLAGEPVPERYDVMIIDKSENLRWIEIKSTVISWEDKPAVLTFLTDITN